MIGNSDDEYLGHPVNWGNAWANSAYDIKNYERSKDCNDIEPKDCKDHGGYLNSDPCK